MPEKSEGLFRHFVLFFQKMFTVPKAIVLVMFAGMAFGAWMVLLFVLDVLKGKTEDFVTNWTLTRLHGNTAKKIAAWIVTTTIHYPDTVVLAVFLSMILLIGLITAGQMAFGREKDKSLQGSAPTPAKIIKSTPHPNLRFIATRFASIAISHKSGLDWRIANVFDDSSISQALLAVVSNIPRRAPVGDAYEVKAQISYQWSDGHYMINPATWLGTRSPANIGVGDQRELVLAICNDHWKDGRTPEAFLQSVEDRRDARNPDINYDFGPWMLAETVATVFLTVNGIAEEPIRFKLFPSSPEEHKRPSAQYLDPRSTQVSKIARLWTRLVSPRRRE